MKKNNLIALVEGAAMIALAAVLSMITLVEMPFGGSITACSMLPIILLAYRRGTKWGLFTALVYAVLQMFLGFNNLRYGTSFAAVCAIIFLDYIFAFVVLGLAGIFRNKIKSQTTGMLIGTVLCCFLRFLCHFISGCTVWAGVSIPEIGGMIYSATYNAAYMIPETIVTVAGVWYLSKMLDFRSENITTNREKQPKITTIVEGIGILLIVAAIVFDSLYLFANLQTEDGFSWAAISTINFTVPIIVTVAAVVIWLIAHFIIKQIKSKA